MAGIFPHRAGWLLFAVVSLTAVGSDLLSKSWIFARLGMPGTAAPIELVPRILRLQTNLNEGALFGMGQGLGIVFAGISVLAIAGILGMLARAATRTDRGLVVALGLITGGILGNLYDRLGLPRLVWHAPADRVGRPVYAVRDWIHFELPGIIDWPIFNLADSWLVIGAAVMLLATLRSGPDSRSRAGVVDAMSGTAG
ncbi:MAG: signal peptidase II [Planctomycetia bacterium]|jgi:signal peptidase II